MEGKEGLRKVEGREGVWTGGMRRGEERLKE